MSADDPILEESEIDFLAKTYLSQAKLRTDFEKNKNECADILRGLASEFPEIEEQVALCTREILDGAYPRVALRAFFDRLELDFPDILGQALLACEIPLPSPRETRDREKTFIRVFESVGVPIVPFSYQQCIEKLAAKATLQQQYALFACSMELGQPFVRSWHAIRRDFKISARKNDVALEKNADYVPITIDNDFLFGLTIMSVMLDGTYDNDTANLWALRIGLGRCIQQSPLGGFLWVLSSFFGCIFYQSADKYEDRAYVSARTEEERGPNAAIIWYGAQIAFASAATMVSITMAAYSGEFFVVGAMMMSAAMIPLARKLRKQFGLPTAVTFSILSAVGTFAFCRYGFIADSDQQQMLRQASDDYDRVMHSLNQTYHLPRTLSDNTTLQGETIVQIAQNFSVYGITVKPIRDDSSQPVAFMLRIPELVNVTTNATNFIPEFASQFQTFAFSEKVTALNMDKIYSDAHTIIFRTFTAIEDAIRKPLHPNGVLYNLNLRPVIWGPAIRVLRAAFQSVRYWWRNSNHARGEAVSVANALAILDEFPDDMQERTIPVTTGDQPETRQRPIYAPVEASTSRLKYVDAFLQPNLLTGVVEVGEPIGLPAEHYAMAKYFVGQVTVVPLAPRQDAQAPPNIASPLLPPLDYQSFYDTEGNGMVTITTRMDMYLVHALFAEINSGPIQFLNAVLDNITLPPVVQVKRHHVYLDCFNAILQATETHPISERNKMLLACVLWTCFLHEAADSSGIVCYAWPHDRPRPNPIACIVTRSGALERYRDFFGRARQRMANLRDKARQFIENAKGKTFTEFKNAVSLLPQIRTKIDFAYVLPALAAGATATLAYYGPDYLREHISSSISDEWIRKGVDSVFKFFSQKSTYGLLIFAEACVNFALDPVISFMENKRLNPPLPSTEVEAAMDAFMASVRWARLPVAALVGVFTTMQMAQGSMISYAAQLAAITHIALSIVPPVLAAIDTMAPTALLQLERVPQLLRRPLSAQTKARNRVLLKIIFPTYYPNVEVSSALVGGPLVPAGNISRRLETLGEFSVTASEILDLYRNGQRDTTSYFGMGAMTKYEALAFLDGFPTATIPVVPGFLRTGFSPQDWVNLHKAVIRFDDVPDARRLWEYVRTDRAGANEERWSTFAVNPECPIFIGPYATLLYMEIYAEDQILGESYIDCDRVIAHVMRTPLSISDLKARAKVSQPVTLDGKKFLLLHLLARFRQGKSNGQDKPPQNWAFTTELTVLNRIQEGL